MPSPSVLSDPVVNHVVVLATGGTIAGRASSAQDNVGYQAGAVGISELVHDVPVLAGQHLETEAVAQLDSKDMSNAVWHALALRCQHHLARDEVTGVVVTHGTDTLEETAWFLHRVLAPRKPLVLTAAMRPATSLQADGPQNLVDAVTLARVPGAAGVLIVMAGLVHGAADVQKMHGYRIDAFESPNDGPIGTIQEGRLRTTRPWPVGHAGAQVVLQRAPETWPPVALLISHACLDSRLLQAQVEALLVAGARGIVVAGTGNGTVHVGLQAALDRAHLSGLHIRRASRCALGSPVTSDQGNGNAGVWPSYAGLNAAKARVELMLELMAGADQAF